MRTRFSATRSTIWGRSITSAMRTGPTETEVLRGSSAGAARTGACARSV
jgi:hypothetical protein